MTDPQKYRREYLRWLILLTLNHARPTGTTDQNVLTVVRAEYPDSTLMELRRELGYVAERKLVSLRKPPDGGAWQAELTRVGIDFVEYTIDCEPGIARPEKYW